MRPKTLLLPSILFALIVLIGCGEKKIDFQVPVGWLQYDNAQMGFSFYYPSDYSQPKMDMMDSSKSRSGPTTVDNLKITGQSVDINFIQQNLEISAETKDFCMYYEDQLYGDSYCRKSEFIPSRCRDYEQVQMCIDMTFKDSYALMIRKKIPGKNMDITISQLMKDLNRTNGGMTEETIEKEIQNLTSQDKEKIGIFTNISRSISIQQ
jgi:hypothetical protein